MAQAELLLHPDNDLDLSSTDDEASDVTVRSKVVVPDKKGVRCPVPDCPVGVVSRHPQALRTHWSSCHEPWCIYQMCPVEGCEVTRKRRTDINRHFRLAHPQFGTTKKESLKALNAVPRVAEIRPNHTFTDPGKIVPPFRKFLPHLPEGCLSFREKNRASLALARLAAKAMRGKAPVRVVKAKVAEPAVGEEAPMEETLTILVAPAGSSIDPENSSDNAGRSSIDLVADTRAQLEQEVAREASARQVQATLRERLEYLQAEAQERLLANYRQRVADLEKRVASLVGSQRLPAPRIIGDLERLPVSRPYFVVPDITGQNRVFLLTREDLAMLRLQDRAACGTEEPL